MNSRQLVFNQWEFFGCNVSNKDDEGFKQTVVSELFFGAKQNVNVGR